MEIESVIASPACGVHPANASVTRCEQCGRAVCHVCVFTFGSATYCPECLTADPGEERLGFLDKGLWSLLLAMVGGALLALFTVAGDQLGDGLATVLSFPWMGATIGGAALALIARHEARRRGSLLPTIGLVANLILVAIQMTFTIIGNFFMK